MLRAQVCQSPFRCHFKAGGTHTVDTYGYNLIWYGTHGPWSTMWSANMMELQEGRFISYLALGNELRLGKQVSLQLDYMNRAAAHQTYFFRDCMVMGQLSYRPSEKFNLFAKACYDVNNTDNAEDLCVMMQRITRIGCATKIRQIRRSFTTICEILGRAKRVANPYHPHGYSFYS